MKMSTRMKKVTSAVDGFLSKHGTTILTTIGIISEGIAVYEMYKATEIVKEKLAEVDKNIELSCQYDHAEPPTKVQRLVRQTKAIAPVLAPTVLWFTFGAGCHIAAHKADGKKIVALTSAYELSEARTRDYIAKVRDKFGEKKAKEVEDEYYQEQAEKNMPTGPRDTNICITGKGDQLYYDEGSGRFFRASPQWLERCKVDISHEVFVNDNASVNDFYYILGIPAIDLGNGAGWESTHDLDGDNLIDMRWDLRAGTSEWGETFGYLSYRARTRFRV